MTDYSSSSDLRLLGTYQVGIPLLAEAPRHLTHHKLPVPSLSCCCQPLCHVRGYCEVSLSACLASAPRAHQLAPTSHRGAPPRAEALGEDGRDDAGEPCLRRTGAAHLAPTIQLRRFGHDDSRTASRRTGFARIRPTSRRHNGDASHMAGHAAVRSPSRHRVSCQRSPFVGCCASTTAGICWRRMEVEHHQVRARASAMCPSAESERESACREGVRARI